MYIPKYIYIYIYYIFDHGASYKDVSLLSGAAMILVTGGAGFVGSNLIADLEERIYIAKIQAIEQNRFSLHSQ